MKTDVIISLDVGGTSIKGCVLQQNRILENSHFQFPSKSDKSKETILDHFADIILHLWDFCRHHLKKYEDAAEKQIKVIGIGFAFPGPFDYPKGISYIKGLNKYDALYGISIPDELSARLNKRLADKTFKMLFENDARLFGLGAGTIYPKKRLIGLTIGTGLGSVFIENGKILTDDTRIPREGYLYSERYKGVLVDNRFSRRGILEEAVKVNLEGPDIDVKEIADMAKEGNSDAIALFERFGSEMGEMLIPFIKRFLPHIIVVGGQIAKSFDLFGPRLKAKVEPLGCQVVHLDNALHYTHLGVLKMFEDYAE